MLELILAMILGKKLSLTQFVLSQVLILTAGLLFLTGLYYILNIQYQKPQNRFANGPVTMPPKTLMLDLSQPDDDSLTFQSSVIISGKTAPGISVLISQDTQDVVIQSQADGSFSTILNLNEGVNRIDVITFDSSGDSKSVGRTIYYSKEKI